jgi:heme/copper-type cytochrome/quinol oxidase subunit 3
MSGASGGNEVSLILIFGKSIPFNITYLVVSLWRLFSFYFWVYLIFSFNSYKIPFVSLQGWGKTKAIFMKVQFCDTPFFILMTVVLLYSGLTFLLCKEEEVVIDVPESK